MTLTLFKVFSIPFFICGIYKAYVGPGRLSALGAQRSPASCLAGKMFDQMNVLGERKAIAEVQ